MKYALLFILITALTLSACTNSTSIEGSSSTTESPKFEFTTVNGKTVSSETDKPSIIYFMASWCPSCAKNWDVLSKVAPDYEDSVNIFAISIDPSDTNDVLAELAEQKNFMFEIVAGNPEFANALNVRAQTTIIGINSSGEVAFQNSGIYTENEWRKMIESVQ